MSNFKLPPETCGIINSIKHSLDHAIEYSIQAQRLDCSDALYDLISNIRYEVQSTLSEFEDVREANGKLRQAAIYWNECFDNIESELEISTDKIYGLEDERDCARAEASAYECEIEDLKDHIKYLESHALRSC